MSYFITCLQEGRKCILTNFQEKHFCVFTDELTIGNIINLAANDRDCFITTIIIFC